MTRSETEGGAATGARGRTRAESVTSPRRRSGVAGFLLDPFAVMFGHRRLIAGTTMSEMRGLYAGSVLGMFWIAVGPLLLLALYATIYAVIFRFRPSEMTQSGYVLYICAGLMPFIAFATALGAGATSLTANKQVLLNTVFPAELIPLRVVLVNSTTLVVGLTVVIAIDAVLDRTSVLTLLIPILVLFQVLFVTGVVWVLGLLNLIVRDVQQSLTFVVLALLVITPIAYTPSMVPALLAPIMYANPLAYYVVSYQHIVVLNELPPTGILVGALLAGPLLFCGGYRLFRQAKKSFFDYA